MCQGDRLLTHSSLAKDQPSKLKKEVTFMLISASRRTDLPAYYSDWLYTRFREGFVLVPNPVNPRQVSRVKLTPDVVDGIVFWTKNPLPMLPRLGELKDYMYYFQFTLTPYEKDIEPGLPDKGQKLVPVFKSLSELLGADRVIWRYDPILLNEKYTAQFHLDAFAAMAKELHPYTRKVTVSFIDTDYRGVKGNLKELALKDFPPSAQERLGSSLAQIARSYGLTIDTCAEKIDLLEYGIGKARCVDDRQFEKLLGCPLNLSKDKSQRQECGCVTSIDIGTYNSCPSSCRYCYANYSPTRISANINRHDPRSPLLLGPGVSPEDKVSNRTTESCRSGQLQIKGL